MIKSFFGDPRNKDRETKRQHYAEIEGGIKINPVPITAGDKVNVLYDGVLADSGADKVYLHAGYGHPQDWREVIDQPMVRTNGGWEATMRVENASRFNFCFKDSAGNWDNNQGRNWSYEIHYGGL
ncbi:MAG: carbohydrate-binding protein [Firmicutes bacterium]|nr:carbohydrate-binding protein [Bacillota bacterium]